MDRNRYRSKPPQKRKISRNSFNLIVIALLCVIIYTAYNSMSNPPLHDLGGNAELHVIDVGQGDSLLLLSPGGTVLIDAGPVSARDEVTAYLKKTAVEKIDCFILTHPHEDHIGGAAAVLDGFEVAEVIIPDRASSTRVYENLLGALERSAAEVREPIPGEVIEFGSLELTILAPLGSGYSDTNDFSIVVRAVYGETVFLFMGDATTKIENELIAAYPADKLRCDLLKLGHHGSSTSSSERFLDITAPSIALVCCGADNTFGHPSRVVVERLNERGIKIHRADHEGDMVFVSNGKEIVVE